MSIPDWPDNLAFHWNHQYDDLDSAFRTADIVIELTLVNQRVYAAFLEPRAAAAMYDERSRQLTI